MTPVKSSRQRSVVPASSARARHSPAAPAEAAADDVVDFSDVTYRIYSPSELKNVALRPSNLPSTAFAETEPEDRTFRPSTLAKYMGVGFVATMILFAGFIVIMNSLDDTLIPMKGGPTYMSTASPAPKAPKTKPATVDPTTSAYALTGLTPTPSPGQPSDFELPDDATPVQRTAVKNAKPKQGKRSIRSAP